MLWMFLKRLAIQNDVLVFRFLTRTLFAISIFKLYYFLQIYKDNFNDEPANKNKSPGKRNPKRAKKQVVGSDDSAKQDDKTEFAAWDFALYLQRCTIFVGDYDWTRLQSGLLHLNTILILKYAFTYTYLFGNDRFTGFNSRAIMLDGVVDITQSILSTGWNPLSEIVGFLFEEDQLAYVEQLKHNCDSENFQVQLQKFMEGMFQYYSCAISFEK